MITKNEEGFFRIQFTDANCKFFLTQESNVIQLHGTGYNPDLGGYFVMTQNMAMQILPILEQFVKTGVIKND